MSHMCVSVCPLEFLVGQWKPSFSRSYRGIQLMLNHSNHLIDPGSSRRDYCDSPSARGCWQQHRVWDLAPVINGWLTEDPSMTPGCILASCWYLVGCWAIWGHCHLMLTWFGEINWSQSALLTGRVVLWSILSTFYGSSVVHLGSFEKAKWGEGVTYGSNFIVSYIA